MFKKPYQQYFSGNSILTQLKIKTGHDAVCQFKLILTYVFHFLWHGGDREKEDEKLNRFLLEFQ